jgi:hypothetical protein
MGIAVNRFKGLRCHTRFPSREGRLLSLCAFRAEEKREWLGVGSGGPSAAQQIVRG